ncbi:TPA: hypothetical protein NR419_002754 [Listeria innocua]|nr:hypothetical protein [Listeria innocua]
MTTDIYGCKWYSIEECLDYLDPNKETEGVYLVGFQNCSNLEFIKNEDNNNLVSVVKLNEHYNKTDKEILLIESSKNLYQSISFFGKDKLPVNLKPKSAKVLWQIINRPELKVKFLEIPNAFDEKKELVKKYSETRNVVPLGNKSFNDNDAIPTWSGFNYQGKGVILRAIQLINELWEEEKSENEIEQLLKDYFIEVELKEDFVLYHKKIPTEYVQVKATLAEKTYSGYTKAVKQLLDHRSEGTNSEGAKCILMSAITIRNWKKDCSVSLYKYQGESIGLLEMPEIIKKEISILLKKMEQLVDDFKVKIIYENLCGLLDQRVREIHVNGKGYCLDLHQDIWKNIKLFYFEQEENALFSTYELLYNKICLNLISVIDSRCEECRKGHTEYDCETCPIPSMRDNFIVTNLLDYVHVLNPNKIIEAEKVDQILSIAETFSEKELKNLFNQFEFAHIDNYRWNPTYHMLDMGKGNHIIPTLLDFGNENFEESISSTFSSIIGNIRIRSIIDGKALTVVKPGSFESTNIMENNITNYKEVKDRIRTEDGYDVSKSDLRVNAVNVTFVDRMGLIRSLRKESDKH